MIDNKLNESVVARLILVITLGAALYGAALATQANFSVRDKIAKTEEAARPAKIELIKITAPDCVDCAIIDEVIVALKQESVQITGEREVPYSNDEGRALVESLGIERVPTYVLKGEVANEKLAAFVQSNGEIKSDQFIYTKTHPIFIDPKTGERRGELRATVLAAPKACADCYDLSSFLDQLEKAGVKITERKTFDITSVDGRALAAAYSIDAAPTFVLSADAKYYDLLGNGKLGNFASDGTFIFRATTPPYWSLSEGKTKGLVRATFLVDGKCTECYSIDDQRNILTGRFGMKLSSDRVVDISGAEGKQLVSKYKITAVPAFVLSAESSLYSQLLSVWSSVGTVESDGSMVFRNASVMGVYKDLVKNEVVDPAAALPASAEAPASTDDSMAGHH